ncbi:MAG: [Fe-Fe] hydrogenase large subunit C-terminal domain-containing protein [Pseudomonadota bacterium]
MNRDSKSEDSCLSVLIKPNRCNGCVVCLRACPTQAIRIRDGRAVIMPELCVDCGECLRACPRRAIESRVSTSTDMAGFKVTAVLPSPVIYTQFGDEVMPNEILAALSKLGFDYVFDLAKYCEWGNMAAAQWMAEHPEIRTAFSPICPVVLKLIRKRFPNLIPNIIPLEPPREFGARHIRGLLRKKLGLRDEEIGVFYVTPCAAKVKEVNQPLTSKKSYLSGALGLHHVFGGILKALKDLTDEDRETIYFNAGGYGIGWELAEVRVSGLQPMEKTLAVSGLAGVLEVLDQVESGRLSSVRFMDLRVCPDGCLGGPLTVENQFMARATLRRLMRMFGEQPRVRPGEIARFMEEGFFRTDKEILPDLTTLDPNPLEAMKKLKLMDQLTNRLPGKRCGVCGAPDCRTLAEDVVLGKAALTDCPFYHGPETERGKIETG